MITLLDTFMALPWFWIVGLLVLSMGVLSYLLTPASASHKDGMVSSFIGLAVIWTVIWGIAYQDTLFLKMWKYAITYFEIGICFAVIESVWVAYLFRVRVLEIQPSIKKEALKNALSGPARTKAAITAYMNGTYSLDSEEYSWNDLYTAITGAYLHQMNYQRGDATFLCIGIVPNFHQLEDPAHSNVFKVNILKAKLLKFLAVSAVVFPLRMVKMLFGDMLRQVAQFIAKTLQAKLQKLVNYLFKDLLKG